MSAAIALFVFLVIALITSQLASMVRHRADEATESEHKLRILYELLRVYSLTNKLDEQLDCIALSTNRVFSTWGIIACVILLPDRNGKLQVRADAPITLENFVVSESERQEAQKVLSTNLSLSIKNGDAHGSVLHLIPLRTTRQPFGVLYLSVKGSLPWLRNEDSLQQALYQNSPQATFFWAYLDEISGLIERALAYQQMLTNQ
jgi:K+-sensing histidine kinase KdpD